MYWVNLGDNTTINGLMHVCIRFFKIKLVSHDVWIGDVHLEDGDLKIKDYVHLVSEENPIVVNGPTHYPFDHMTPTVGVSKATGGIVVFRRNYKTKTVVIEDGPYFGDNEVDVLWESTYGEHVERRRVSVRTNLVCCKKSNYNTKSNCNDPKSTTRVFMY